MLLQNPVMDFLAFTREKRREAGAGEHVLKQDIDGSLVRLLQAPIFV